MRVGFVVGEESGERLAVAIAKAIRAERPHATFHGVGGGALQELGLKTLFDPSEIALMGFTAVLPRVPRLLRLIGMTADALATAELDVVVLVDAPDFTHRVAAKLRRRAPNLPIVKVVAPTVWAWRPGRAAALAPLVDEVLALFPFEPEVMKRLGGPPTHFVGHPLIDEVPRPGTAGPADGVLVLPGSRRSEIERLCPAFGDTLGVLARRGWSGEATVATPPARASLVAREIGAWPVRPDVVTDDVGKRSAFHGARAALAASGTVTLELALNGVPTVVAYKVATLERQIARRLTIWAIAMPNIVADWVVMPELVDDTVRPERMARMLERLLDDTPERAAQLEGFARVREALTTGVPFGSAAAERVLTVADRGRKAG